MSFRKKDVEKLLVDTGRLCCLCKGLRPVQAHHIIPRKDGGTDEIDNAITLCPNCHEEVGSRGRTTRQYTPEELKQHREMTIELVSKRAGWAPGTSQYEQDKELVLFYAQCLDRPAFKTRFHEEVRFSDFDKAMEDTLLALNTGYWRTREGDLIDRARGKMYVVNPEWRMRLDTISRCIVEIRNRFQEAVGFKKMPFEYGHFRGRILDRDFDKHLRANRELGAELDFLRNFAISEMNIILYEIEYWPLDDIS
ncbi:MAG: HNH endonuclease [Actinobacteria bacterium]|nr:HNH endonuclease [Actinomycetota bacterium]